MFLSLKNVSRSFGSTKAVSDVSLDVAQGEFFGLLGPSGCGKTTTLRMIAGLENPDAGSIEFQGTSDTAFVDPKLRLTFLSDKNIFYRIAGFIMIIM